MALNAKRYRFYNGDSGAEQSFLDSMYAKGYTAASVLNATDQVLTGKGTKLLDAVASTTAVLNTTARTPVISEVIGGSTNPVVAGDVYVLAAWGDQQNSVGTVAYTLDFAFDATIILATTSLSFTVTTNRRKWWLESQIIMPTLTTQNIGVIATFGTQGAGGWVAGTSTNASGMGSSTVDFSAANASKTLTLNVTQGVSTATTEFRCAGYTLTRVR